VTHTRCCVQLTHTRCLFTWPNDASLTWKKAKQILKFTFTQLIVNIQFCYKTVLSFKEQHCAALYTLYSTIQHCTHCTALYRTVHTVQDCTAQNSAVNSTVGVYSVGVRTLNKPTRPGFDISSALFLRIPFLWYMMMVCHWVYDVAVSLGIWCCVTSYMMLCL